MQRRVRLGAIAKDEGPYLAEWVFHHLHLGVDEVEVWVNGTGDTSVGILEALGAVDPRVRHRVVDDLLAESLARGKNFQHRAYARMARRARREGVTHHAFWDLDEYWWPRDLATPLGAFLPHDDEVNVVSFPWAVDLPDPSRPAFAPPFEPPPRVQLDPHVKSVVRLDDRLQQQRTHTARTTAGTRLWVDEPLPLRDERRQQWGSLVPHDWLAQRWQELPRAFVLHAVHRSPVEYVASLAKGLRQTGNDLAVKDNRPGFVASPAPALAPLAGVSGATWAAYLRARDDYLARAGVGPLVAAAQEAARSRAAALVASATADPQVMQRLRAPLRGLTVPALDERYPGWAAPALQHCVDTVERTEAGLVVTGWAYDDQQRPVELSARRDTGEIRPVTWTTVPRPDVVRAHPRAPEACGFRAVVPGRDPDRFFLRARPVGAELWDEWSLADR